MEMMGTLGRIAGALGRGFVAGAIGTAAMTLSSTIEMKWRNRPPSKAPAEALEEALGVDARTEEDEWRLATLIHWDYGTGWGAMRGLLDVVSGLRGAPATVVHGLTVWTAALVMLPALRISPPVAEMPPKELAIDAWHHAVYAVAAGAAYGLLTRQK
jgi:hypothetical protein